MLLQRAEELTQKDRKCVVSRIREQLNPEDQSDLDILLADSKYSNSTIARSLADIGHPVSRDAVRLHKMGDCACLR